MPAELPPPALLPWLERHIGRHKVLRAYRVHSARTGVWRLQSTSGDFFLKLYKEKRKWHPEVYAYRQWAPACRPHVPEIVAVFDQPDHCGILVTALDGIPLREANLPSAKALECYAEAGALLQKLHQLEGTWFGVPDFVGEPAGCSHTEPVDYMREDFHSFYDHALALDCLTDDELQLADWALHHFDVFAGEKPVASHRDFTPGNWLVDANGKFVGLIDLECMLWSIVVDSLPMLFQRYFPYLAGSEEAFFDGYGEYLPDTRAEQVRHVHIKAGIASTVWSTEHGRARDVRLGHELLARITAGELSSGFPSSRA